MSSKIKKHFVWVPNLFTLGNLTLGFFAIIVATDGSGDPRASGIAAIFIMLAVVFDGFDGFAARLLDARSELGAQLDSLADLTTFGIAPGVLMYSVYLGNWQLEVSEKLLFPAGMMTAAVFPAFAAFRLARFNVAHSSESFVGLPSPVGGIIVALMALMHSADFALPGPLAVTVFLAVGLLMVSTLRYEKFQVTLIQNHSPFRLIVAILFLFTVFITIYIRYGYKYSVVVLFILFLVYVVSGIVSLVIHIIQEYRI